MDCGRFGLCHCLSNGHFVSAINLQRNPKPLQSYKVYSLNGKRELPLLLIYDKVA